MLGIFRKFYSNRFIIIFRFGTDISIYIIIKARLTIIRIIGILIAFLLITGIVLIQLEEEGEEACQKDFKGLRKTAS